MAEYDVSGTWTATQNGPIEIEFSSLHQTGSDFDGVAFFGSTHGNVEGKVDDIRFQATVTWNPDSSNEFKGEYYGIFNINGRLTGLTVQLSDLSKQATWCSEKRFSRREE